MAVIRSVGEKVDCNTQFINKLKSGNCRLCHFVDDRSMADCIQYLSVKVNLFSDQW